ncbi:helix-turn-helix domain-containing protein [Anaerocolumna jejuensis]|uniref:helix-turn-helix domain-containing protein n=1 Tax=Anaerocolumna jejuensis TaxID=259063 RepID=UPI003F7B51E8
MEYITQNVARNLKRIRKNKEMSLDDVSKQTGISKSMLGQIERGVSVPTVETLGKLVSGLRVSFNSLISSEKNDIITVNKKDLAPSYISEDARYKAYEYFPYEEDRTFEVYMMDLEAHSGYLSEGHGDNTYEFLTVFTGTLTLKVDGKTYEIEAENSIRFPTNSSHEYVNNGDVIVKFSVTFTWD